MKGIELLASVLAILMLIGVTSLLGTILIFFLESARQPSAEPITYELFLSSIYPPIKFETMLLSYLESTEPNSGFQVKKILAYAAYQSNVTNIFVEGKEVTTLGTYTSDVFSGWMERNGFLIALQVDGKIRTIADNRRSFQNLPTGILRIKKISIPLYLEQNLIAANIYNKGEVPLNVTLDFYVQ